MTLLSLRLSMDVGVQDTAAYRVIRQITDHTWGSETDLSDSDVLGICRDFWQEGGSWEGLMGGDMRSIEALERCIDGLVGPRKMVASLLVIPDRSR